MSYHTLHIIAWCVIDVCAILCIAATIGLRHRAPDGFDPEGWHRTRRRFNGEAQ